MRTLIDCHMHTARCGHAKGKASEYVSAAEKMGLSAIVVTDHLPLPEGYNPDGCYAMALDEIEAYASEVYEAAKNTGIDVILGAEADWIPAVPEETQAIRNRARSAGVQVLLGSVHFIDDWAFDDPDLIIEWEARSVEAVWESYFARWCDAARSGEFDVMAHPDLVKKFGHRPSSVPFELYEEAAIAASEGGVIIEVSTGGLRKPVAELYPGPELLTTFHAKAVPACVGSDAHAPDEIAYDIDRAYEALAEAGYDSFVLPLGAGQTRRYSL